MNDLLGRHDETQGEREGDADRTSSFTAPVSNQFGGRFLLLRPQAEGGLGSVWVALDVELNREVALKRIRPEHADDPGSRARFELEAEVTGRLEHPGIVPVYGLGCGPGGRPYYAMRLIKGESLKVAIARFHRAEGHPGRDPGERALDLRRLLERFIDVCNTVSYAHSRGVLHRDLKPSNVMLGPFGETLVVDWGLAKAIGRKEGGTAGMAAEEAFRPSSGSGSSNTQAGSVVGTPAYMSPEQADGRLELLSPSSDVYSLGATLYAILTGRPPVEGTAAEILRRVRKADIPPPRAVNPRAPAELEAVCLKAMAPDPDDRYPSPRELALDLEHWMADEPVSAWREPWGRRLSRWERRNRVLVRVVGAALVLVATVASAASLFVTRAWGTAESARSDAVRAAEAERLQRRKAQDHLRASQVLSARLQVDRGLALCREGDIDAGLLTLAEGLRLVEQVGLDLGTLVRANLAAWAARVSRPRAALPVPTASAAVSVSPDGRVAACWGRDGFVRLWDLPGGEPRDTPLACSVGDGGLAFLPDSARLLTGGLDGRLRLWDVASGEPIGDPIRLPVPIRSLAFDPVGRLAAIGCEDGVIRLWDPESGLLEDSLAPQGPPTVLVALAISPDGSTLAAGGPDGVVRLWDLSGRSPIDASPDHGAALEALAFSPDGRTLLTGGHDRFARLWDATTGSRLGRIAAPHELAVTAVAFQPGGRTFLTASLDTTVRLWDVASGSAIGPPMAHPRHLTDAAFTPDGRTILSAGNEQAVRLWEVAPGLPPLPVARRDAPIAYVRPRPDGRAFAVGDTTGLARFRDSATHSPIGSPFRHPGPALRSAFGPDGRSFLTWDPAGGAVLWDLASDPPTGASLEGSGPLVCADFSRDGRALVTGGFDGVGRLWDVPSGRPLGRPMPLSETVLAAAFGPDDRICWLAGPTSARAWDTLDGSPSGDPIRYEGSDAGGAEFSPDAGLLVVGSFDGTARLWETGSGRRRGPVLSHRAPILYQGFADEGRVVVCRSGLLFWRWDASTGRQLRPGPLSAGPLLDFHLSPDGRTLLVAGSDGNAQPWDLATGRPLGPPWPHLGPVTAAILSPDGRSALTGDQTGALFSWTIPGPLPGDPDAIAEQMRALTGVRLDPDGTAIRMDPASWERLRLEQAPSGG